MATESKGSLLSKFKSRVRTAKQKAALRKAQKQAARNRRMGLTGSGGRGGGRGKLAAKGRGTRNAIATTGPSKRGAAVKTTAKPTGPSKRGAAVKVTAKPKGPAGRGKGGAKPKSRKISLKSKLLGTARIAKGNIRVAAKKAGAAAATKTSGVRSGVSKAASSVTSRAKTAYTKRFGATAKLRRKVNKQNTRKINSAKHLNKVYKKIGATATEIGQASKFKAKRKSYDPRKKR